MENQLSSGSTLCILSIIWFLSWLFCNWHIRATFVAVGMNSKGSYNRQLKRYKSRWSFIQRVCLIPLLQASKFRIYIFLFILNWLHFFLSVLTIVVVLFEWRNISILLPGVYWFCIYGFVVLLEIGITLETGRKG